MIIFGLGKQEIEYYLIIELFGKGNAIFTDQNFIILQLLNQLKGVRVATSYFTNEYDTMTLMKIEEKLTQDYF